jgi:exopolyphosphatase/guanosine-5'-triphosphate,3'-diphosphate pyrophosphatase
MNRYAVIDLGTNTFHLLIVGENRQKIYQERQFVKLAENGIERIGEKPFQRGIHTMLHFHLVLQKFNVQQIQAFGTAALRTASNGAAFIEEVEESTGIEVQLISGEREAALIQKGVALAIPPLDTNSLIMDIGGGSVEFIIANQHQVFWAQSFPIGVAVLYRQFQQNDPITREEVQTLEQFLHDRLASLRQAVQQYGVSQFVGASGTFDVLEDNLPHLEAGEHYCVISAKDFFKYYQYTIFTTVAERLNRKDIPEARAELLVVAFVLIAFLLKQHQFQQIIISEFAMKEGMLAEMFEFK